MASVSTMDCCGIKELDGLARIDTREKPWYEACQAMAEVKEQLTEEGHYAQHYDYNLGQYVQGEWRGVIIHTPAFFVFSQAGTPTDVDGHENGAYGDCFRDFILEQGLGTVQETAPALNENSKNLIKAYIWTVNQDAWKEWDAKTARKEHKKKEAA